MTHRNKKRLASILAYPFHLALWAYVASEMWGWFLTPWIGVPAPNLVQSAGVLLLLRCVHFATAISSHRSLLDSMVRAWEKREEDTEMTPEETHMQLYRIIFAPPVYALLLFVAAFVWSYLDT